MELYGSENEGVVWSWARKHLQGKTKIVNLYYRNQIIDSIKNKLRGIDEHLLRRFEDGCFGHLLGWKCKVSNGQALNALIGRQITSPSLPDHELWFRINETHIRFSFPEFALVTGLHFGTSKFNPTDPEHRASECGVFQRFCGGKEMSVKCLWSLFNNLEKPPDATDEDYLKVANLLFLYLFALGNETRKIPDNFAWVLVDNLVAWNKFPWGAYCYKGFLHYFKNMKTTGEKYHLFGAAWSLQVWAMETIPAMANNIGRIADPEPLPRCLKWTFKRSRKYNYHTLLDIETECHVELEASAVEKTRGYYTSSDDLSWKSVGYIVPVNPLNLHGYLASPDAKKRNRKRKQTLLSDEDESVPTSGARARTGKLRTDDKAGSCSSSSKHVCLIREERIVKKLEARVVPKLDYLKNHLVPNMILVAQKGNQSQAQQQPIVHPKSQVEDDVQQAQGACSSLSRVDIQHDNHCDHQKYYVESEKVNDDVAEYSEHPIFPPQDTSKVDDIQQETSIAPQGRCNGHLEQPIHTLGGNDDHIIDASTTPERRRSVRLASMEMIGGCPPHATKKVLLKGVSLNVGILNALKAKTPGKGRIQRTIRPTEVAGDESEGYNEHGVVGVLVSDDSCENAKRKRLFKKPEKPVFLDCIMYDCLRIKRFYNSGSMAEFKSWYGNGRNSLKQTSVMRTPWELTPIQNLTPSWFKQIYGNRQSISNLHCDVLLNLLVYYRDKKYPQNVFLHDWTVLEFAATSDLMKPILVPRHKDYILKYVNGKLPKQGPRPWWKIQKVYGIALVDNNHWVLYVAHVKKQTLTLYDTIGISEKREKELKKAFGIMAANLATVCHAANVYKKCSYAEDVIPAMSWEIKCVRDAPVQVNLHDCGVLAMKIMECLITGQSVDAVDAKLGGFYRSAYCYELFSLLIDVSKAS